MQLLAKKIEQDDDPLCTGHITASLTCSDHVVDESRNTAELKKTRHKEDWTIHSVQQKLYGDRTGLKCEELNKCDKMRLVFTAVMSSSHVAHLSVSLTKQAPHLNSFLFVSEQKYPEM